MNKSDEMLTGGTVYLGLKIRYPTAGDPERYHWFIWLTDDGQSSICVHATSSTGAFQFEAKPSSSEAVSAITSIARLNGRDLNTLIESLGEIPLETPQEDRGQEFNCRVWVRQAIRMLEGLGVLKCDDLAALEAEVIGYAEANREAVEQGATSAGIYASLHCR
ncbi:hypothetical protein M413DRAFT_94659 [Hebeloma cylindrosporum]|uniref:Uncharacterized protein n=1 Tax=Hebeloma cylindrosporum TaxID=76867 RepID=A0A0C3CZ05_HEBCY|nr:hypothetical protein M413DRAFT_94659 [Hebeloma cylindrosporum h7]